MRVAGYVLLHLALSFLVYWLGAEIDAIVSGELPSSALDEFRPLLAAFVAACNTVAIAAYLIYHGRRYPWD